MNRIDEIRGRIADGSATVLTADEVKQKFKDEKEIADSVDVVTCGTCAVMSGTFAVLSVPVSPPGTFLRADAITINGVPASPGPCPNECLGIVDLILSATSAASPTYGGGDLIRSILLDEELDISVISAGREYRATVSGHELPHARLYTTRSAFKNYMAAINSGSCAARTIFSVTPFEGGRTGVSVSGCGEINPIENDPSMRFLTPGTTILVNGGIGQVIGTGTRSSAEKPNLAVHGEMSGMDPYYCGGFHTSAGPECITSIATAIPILDEQSALPLLTRDEAIPLPLVDISDRKQIGVSSYDRVWKRTAEAIDHFPDRCRKCSPCTAEKACPVQAIANRQIVQDRCFVCGTCLKTCPAGCFQGDLGTVTLDGKEIPVVLRQSDRKRAERLCKLMKEKVLSQEVRI